MSSPTEPAGRPAPRFDAQFAAGFQKRVRRAGGIIFPRESGAIAQFCIPVAGALALSRLHPAALALAISAAAAVLAHEPFMILLNLRGPRVHHEHGARARRQLVVAPLVSAAAAAAGLWLSPQALLPSLVPAVFALPLGALVLSRLEKTAEGEVLLSLTLAAFAFPVAVAGGVPWLTSAWVAGVFAVLLTDATLAVRVVTGVGHDAMTRSRFLAPLMLAIVALAAGFALALMGRAPWAIAWALLPVALFSLWLTLSPPHLRHIRKVGWTMTACSVATLVILVAGL